MMSIISKTHITVSNAVWKSKPMKHKFKLFSSSEKIWIISDILFMKWFISRSTLFVILKTISSVSLKKTTIKNLKIGLMNSNSNRCSIGTSLAKYSNRGPGTKSSWRKWYQANIISFSLL